MVVADGQGIPLGGHLCSASPAEVTLVEATLPSLPNQNAVQRLIADKAYDSQPLRQQLAAQQIQLIAPHMCNRRQPKTQDGRLLRRHRKRWKIERTIGWTTSSRRITIRWDRLLGYFQLQRRLQYFIGTFSQHLFQTEMQYSLLRGLHVLSQ